MDHPRKTPAHPAAVRDLFTQVYDELRRVAANALRQERSDHTLQPTALVHEAFLRLARADSLSVLNRAHVFALAAQAMRRILVDHARTYRAQKRGNALRVPIDDIDAPSPAPDVDLLALDRALVALAEIDARQAQIVELRFFGGLTVEEAADVIGMSARTVKREWQMARAWLKREMAQGTDETGMSDRERLKHLFAVARTLAPAQRTAFLAAAAADAPHLQSEVESLLQFDEDGDDPLEHGPRTLVRQVALDLVEPPAVGDSVGPWRVIDVAGRGGMGIVYRAARADAAFETVVALKLIHAGLESREAIARFGRERDVLAALDHPHIARLLDAGVSSRGVPYVAMEFVDGQSLTRYADGAGLDVDARLRLFCDVCDAVGHAHRHLIVHRDLKPDNVLVTPSGLVKLVDFGLAKLLDEADDGVHTATRIMTPTYASPEQMVGGTLTTATDVYSLGVVLYELLTGEIPHRVPNAGRDLAAVVRGDTPGALGTAVSARATDEERASVASRRATTPEGLRRRLSGDLDAIVQKALRHDPPGRYASVDAFAQDVRRHLDGRAVSARRGTWRYHAALFARRNRGLVATACVAVLGLAGGGLTTAWQAGIAARERDHARAEQARAERTKAFVQEMLASPDPGARGRDVKVADVLASARTRLDRDLGDQPSVRADVLATIGRTYFGLGLFDEAAASLKEAIASMHAHPGDDATALASTLVTYGELLMTRGESGASEAALLEALHLIERLDPPSPSLMASVLNEFGSLRQSEGKLADAEQYHRRSLGIRRAIAKGTGGDLVEALNDLGVVLGTQGRFAEAKALHEEAVEVARRTFGNEHPDTGSALLSLAFVTAATGDMAGAERACREAVAIRRKALGASHPDYAWAEYQLGTLLLDTGRYDEALAHANIVLALRGTTMSDGHPITAAALVVAGSALLHTGHIADAIARLRESLALRRAHLPADHWLIEAGASQLAEALLQQHAYAEAQTLLETAAPALVARLGPDHEQSRLARERLQRVHEARAH